MASVITRDDWRILNMPLVYETVWLNESFNASDCKALLQGYLPKGTDDRWFMYSVDDWIYLHRSWTGHCIFRVQIEIIEQGCMLTQLHINRDSSQYRSTNSEADKSEVKSVLKHLIIQNTLNKNS
jgi:8-oxo-dGTP diphosphatase